MTSTTSSRLLPAASLPAPHPCGSGSSNLRPSSRLYDDHHPKHGHHHHHRHHCQESECGSRSRSKSKEYWSMSHMMPRSTLYILVKYAIFLNWTLTGFWIIYNSSDYSHNAQIISEKIASFSDQINKENVVYCLICYTITLSCITFFGLVGVCYENFCLTLSLAIGYAIYILFDVVSNAFIGVPFNLFFILLQVMLTITCLNLFYFSFLIRIHMNSEVEESRIFFDHRSHAREQRSTTPAELESIQLR